MNIFFTSDTHFFHKNIIKYSSNRSHFSDVEEMNESIIEQWNDTINNDDVVYHLGDFAFSNAEKATNIAKRLNGKIYLIPGNHDHKLIKSIDFCNCFEEILPKYYELKIGKQFIILCHYPIFRWNGMEYDSLHFHGHTHGTLPTYHKNAIDVGIDANPYGSMAPWEYSEIISHITS